MSIKHVMSKDNNRWRQEIDEENSTINLIYANASLLTDRVFTVTSRTTYESQLMFILNQIEFGSWSYVRKCKAKRLVGR